MSYNLHNHIVYSIHILFYKTHTIIISYFRSNFPCYLRDLFFYRNIVLESNLYMIYEPKKIKIRYIHLPISYLNFLFFSLFPFALGKNYILCSLVQNRYITPSIFDKTIVLELQEQFFPYGTFDELRIYINHKILRSW